ncbi:MAG TPA: hypothetical protein DET40_08300 [Lentisphaeria bacterium]|nr:MAG: hypothetical protein A2X45_10515 [Lentisphaerae bacterium GWF2_50_93]HCE43534.1 hypothetical protein [Lentisphaeria bacterium]
MKKEIMPIENIPDWEMRIKRQDAFWNCEIIDRPVVNISFGRKNPVGKAPAKKEYARTRDRWMDSEQIADWAVYNSANTVHCGDSLPFAFPNIGPEVFSAFFGMEMEYGESTSWGIPNLHDWSKVSEIKFSKDNFYWKKIIEMTDVLLEKGKGRYYTGYTDIHPGGDAIAGFRDPLNLNMDMIDCPEDVRKLRKYVDDVFVESFNFYVDKLQGAGQAVCSWPGIVSSKRWHVPSNDFSCMISKEMFDDIFLPGIIRECRNAETSIYHLDGPQALTHLDSLLGIKELNVIQWVYGAGKGCATDWLHVYKKCQSAGKGIQLGVHPDELETIMENLKPEGVWLRVADVKDEETASAIIKKISKWK